MNSNKFHKKYALYGALFGLAFPVIGTIIQSSITYGTLSLDCVVKSQVHTPLLWIIDTAPFFLGLFASFAGTQMDSVKVINRHLEERYNEMNRLRVLADEASIAKSSFLANMSHEIRTPMNSILGFSDLLSETSLGRDQRKYIDIIKQSSKNLLVIINDILDLSKIQANKLDVKKESVNLNVLVSQLESFFMPTANQKGIDLVIENEGAKLPYEIVTDEVRLTQILSNLISNSFKFTQEGRVELFVEVGEEIQGKVSLAFSVKDTGMGIPKDKLEHIFGNFNQLDTQLNRTIEGTGLGLSICKKLVSLMGGSLHVNSTVDVGTVFSFCLECGISYSIPIKDDAVNARAAFELARLKVLVAEDNLFNQELIRVLLKQNGLEVDIVANGQLAVEAVRSVKYDLILMDVHMPVMDGVTAMKIIKKEIKGLPIIALTANAINGEKDKMVKEGFDFYLSKPLKMSDLKDVLIECTQ
jgi:signal transduction histidine kinase/CheY-like chemotaxis protein